MLWFKKSNQYIVLDKSLYRTIKAFLASKTKKQFKEAAIKLGFDTDDANQLFKEITTLLEECNVKSSKDSNIRSTFNSSYRDYSHTYQVDNQFILVHYGSEHIRSLVHPQLEHLQVTNYKETTLCVFDLYMEADRLFLFKDETLLGSWPDTDYHLLQGKFAMHVLCSINDNEESDWLGTFHASTVVKNDQAVMIIGDSGKGKSTFTALLLADGFEVLADDLTPILSKDMLVYPYPGGISIKSGAFDTLNFRLPNFDNLPQHYINPYKGYVKYVSVPKSKGYTTGYPCKTIVRINYEEDSRTKLETISIAHALETLIPESWLASNQANAQRFLNWIKDVNFYELTYSDSKDAIKVFSQLFKE